MLYFFFTQFITIQCNLDHCQLETNCIQLNLIIQNSLISKDAIAVKDRQVDWAEKRIRDFKSLSVLTYRCDVLLLFFLLFVLLKPHYAY